MKYILFSILFAILSLNTFAKMGSSCVGDYYVSEQIGEYYFYERMKIKNLDGEVIGAMLVNFNSSGSLEGIFICGGNRNLGGQYFFGLSSIVSYDDLLSDGSNLKNINPYRTYSGLSTVEFYHAKTISENNEMVVIEATIRARSIESGQFVAGEKVLIEVRKEEFLYE